MLFENNNNDFQHFALAFWGDEDESIFICIKDGCIS